MFSVNEICNCRLCFKALKETALTRMILPAPILLLPPIVMTFLERCEPYVLQNGS